MCPLFAVDNHAPDFPEFFPVDEATSTFLRELLAFHYPQALPSASQIQAIGRVNLNSNNYRLDSWYLKVLTTSDPVQLIDFFPELVSRLHSNRIPVVPIHPTAGGERIFSFAYQQQKFSGLLQSFVEGSFFIGDREQLQTTCNILKSLRHAAGLAPKNAIHNTSHNAIHLAPFSQYDPEEATAHCFPALKAAGLVNLMALLPPQSRLREIATSFKAHYSVLDTSFLHHLDLHPHNLLYRGNDVVAVLDLESFRAMPHELSLAFALFKLTRKAVSLRRLTLEEVRAILQREIYSDYSPVQLLALAQGELLRRILLILKLNLTANDQRWNADLAKHLAGLEEAEQVFS